MKKTAKKGKLPTGITYCPSTERLRGRVMVCGEVFVLYQEKKETDARFVKRFENFKYDAKQGQTSHDKSVTFDSLYKKWISKKELTLTKNGTSLKKSTVNTYTDVYKNAFSPKFGKKQIKTLNKISIETFLAECAKEYSNAKMKQIYAILNGCLSYAYKTDILNENPMDKVDRIVSTLKQKEVFALSKEETGLFFHFAEGTYYYDLLSVMVKTGLRINEITALQWSDVDIEKKDIFVRRNLYYDREAKSRYLTEPKSKSSIRHVPMLNNVVALFKKMKSQMTENGEPVTGFVFKSKKGNMVYDTAVRDSIRRIINNIHKAGYTSFPTCITPHSFRHTFATRAIESGMSMLAVSKILGHESVIITQKYYIHVLNAYQASEIRKLEGNI